MWQQPALSDNQHFMIFTINYGNKRSAPSPTISSCPPSKYKFVCLFVCFWRPAKDRQPKERKERLGAKQKIKVKSKAYVSSSEGSSDSDGEKLKIADA